MKTTIKLAAVVFILVSFTNCTNVCAPKGEVKSNDSIKSDSAKVAVDSTKTIKHDSITSK